MIPALNGLAVSAMFRGDLRTSHELAVRYAKLAEGHGRRARPDPGRGHPGERGQGGLGRHGESEPRHERVIELYEPAQQPAHMARRRWDPRVVASVTHAASTAIRGEPDRAVQMFRATRSPPPRRRAHPFAIAIALQIGAWVHHLRLEAPETLHYAEAPARLAGEHGFPVFAVLADAFGGWAGLVHTGQPEQRARVRARRWRRAEADRRDGKD